MNKPNDIRVRQAVEKIFDLPSFGSLARMDATLKSRNLLHHWSLSRVERLTFRAPELPSMIFKAVLPPLQTELDIYRTLLTNNPPWAATFYGHVWEGEELWLFLEDVGSTTLRNSPTMENLLKATTLLASLHVAFAREVSSGTLQQRSRLQEMDYPAYLDGARQALNLTETLVAEGKFPDVDSRRISKLESVIHMYDRVALALVGAPQTLVHGDYIASNIAIADDRIVLLDWATAFIGAGLTDLVDLATFATATFGPETMPRLLQAYRRAYRQASGEQIDSEPLEELFVCSQIEKKMSQIRWFDQCALLYIPTGAAAYNKAVAGLIDDVYELTTILV